MGQCVIDVLQPSLSAATPAPAGRPTPAANAISAQLSWNLGPWPYGRGTCARLLSLPGLKALPLAATALLLCLCTSRSMQILLWQGTVSPNTFHMPDLQAGEAEQQGCGKQDAMSDSDLQQRSTLIWAQIVQFSPSVLAMLLVA